MGRCVYDQTGKFVWKYMFAEQKSEQYKIVRDFGIGTIRQNSDWDTLSLEAAIENWPLRAAATK